MGRTELVAQKHQGKESNVATDIAQTALPPIVSREEWQAARDALLVKEKAHTRAKDALSAERRRLPMVEVDGSYLFDGPEGERTLLELFDGRRQLIVQHFMFHPDWDKGCPGCTASVNDIGTVAPLHDKDTSSCWCHARRSRSYWLTGSKWDGTFPGTPRAAAPSIRISTSPRKMAANPPD